MAELVRFYSDLYASKVSYRHVTLLGYLQSITLSKLSDANHASLDSPLTVEELQKAFSSFPTFKAPGDDGLSMEVFQKYSDILMP